MAAAARDSAIYLRKMPAANEAAKKQNGRLMIKDLPGHRRCSTAPYSPAPYAVKANTISIILQSHPGHFLPLHSFIRPTVCGIIFNQYVGVLRVFITGNTRADERIKNHGKTFKNTLEI